MTEPMTVYVCIEEELQHTEIWDVHVAFVTFDEAKAKEWVRQAPSNANGPVKFDRIYRAAELDGRN